MAVKKKPRTVKKSDSFVHVESNAREVMEQLAKLGDFDELEQKQITRSMAKVYLVDMKKRVSNGISTDGSKFKDYSKTPMYAAKKRGMSRAIGTPWGKTNKQGHRFKRFKSGARKGKLHRSRFLLGGYAELRKLTGRNLNEDRLTFHGTMQENLTVDDYGKGGAVVHYPRDEENKKASGNQLKYTFFFPTKKEKQRQLKEGQLEIENITIQKGFTKT